MAISTLGRSLRVESCDRNPPYLDPELKQLNEQINALVQNRLGDWEALLALLRMMETAHREIRDTAFQESLPSTRHGLYSLLREIDQQGGWPYIPRLKLQALLHYLSESESENDEAPADEGNLSSHSP